MVTRTAALPATERGDLVVAEDDRGRGAEGVEAPLHGQSVIAHGAEHARPAGVRGCGWRQPASRSPRSAGAGARSALRQGGEPGREVGGRQPVEDQLLEHVPGQQRHDHPRDMPRVGVGRVRPAARQRSASSTSRDSTSCSRGRMMSRTVPRERPRPRPGRWPPKVPVRSVLHRGDHLGRGPEHLGRSRGRAARAGAEEVVEHRVEPAQLLVRHRGEPGRPWTRSTRRPPRRRARTRR